MSIEKFTFESANGTKIEVPFFQDTFTRKEMKSLNKALKSAKDGESEQEEALLEAAAAKDGYPKGFIDAIDNLSMRDYTNFFKGWAEAGDVNLGES